MKRELKNDSRHKIILPVSDKDGRYCVGGKKPPLKKRRPAADGCKSETENPLRKEV